MDHIPVIVADTPLRRLRGLLGHREPPPYALRLDGCRAVHTFGMRFTLDLHWLARDGTTLRIDRAVPPNRLRACARAHAVLEVPAPRLS
jgi:uncharacterized membrane protein (UPF0127 family)